MQKQIKKDNTLFRNIFLLCGVILILGISSFITDYQYKSIREKIKNVSLENKQLMSENQTLKDKVENLEMNVDLESILKETAIEDVGKLRNYYNEIIAPYMNDFEDLTYEYDSLVVDIYNGMSWIMTDYQEKNFEDRLDNLQSDWEELRDKLTEEIDNWVENNQLFY
jgi:regulator of replication initiation timing